LADRVSSCITLIERIVIDSVPIEKRSRPSAGTLLTPTLRTGSGSCLPATAISKADWIAARDVSASEACAEASTTASCNDRGAADCAHPGWAAAMSERASDHRRPRARENAKT
jgi:hypothetical protein